MLWNINELLRGCSSCLVSPVETWLLWMMQARLVHHEGLQRLRRVVPTILIATSF